MIERLSRRKLITAAVVSSAALAVACSKLQAPLAAPAASRPAKSLAFMAGYKPQANISFVGVYVAKDARFFDEQNLDVTIKHASGQGEHFTLLAGKQIQVTTETATDFVKHVANDGLPFTSLAVLTQTGDEALATLKTSGIDEPKKFEGKTVGYKVIPAFEYVAMLKSAGVDRSKIHEVSVGFDPRVLTEKKVDVLPVFKSNEPDTLKRLGFELNLIDPAAYGVQVMGQLWVAHRDLLAADPDLFDRFVKASLHGVSYALDHPKEAIDIVMKYAPTEDRSHQEYMLQVEGANTLTDQTRLHGVGWQSVERWSALQDGLSDFGLIRSKADPATFFADALQQRTRTANGLVWP
jgi:ABC-type nitrate/sulfonate/bicarbonate transport system substrate-binding protein